MTKQAYYKYDEERQAKELAIESFIVEYVKGVRQEDPGLGGNKLWLMYRKEFDHDYAVGHNKFAVIISRNGLNIRQRRRKVPRTTDSDHDLPKYPNLVRHLLATRAGQIIVSDITYQGIVQKDGTIKFCFIHIVTDAYTHQILACVVSDTLKAKHSVKALKIALKSLSDCNPGIRPYHHSDRGVQYASGAYTKLLKANGYQISMTESGNPKDNAIAERVNGILKNELLAGRVFHSRQELEKAVGQAVDFYNNKRPHMSNNMLTPMEARKCEGVLEKKWKCFRDKYLTPIVA